MAIIYPIIDSIENIRPPLTPGEITLVNFLSKTLDDTYEIFVQPFLNGDRPDVILMRRGSGLMIFEVKDWNLVNFQLDKRRYWIINNAIVRSPIEQVLTYKENLYNLHIENLLEKNIKNPKYFSIVNCALYFHKTSTKKLTDFILQNATENYEKFISHFDLLGYDALTEQNIKSILKKRRLDSESYCFDEKLYASFKRFLQPPQHTIDQGIEIPYTPVQLKLSISKSKEQKIKGVAGCGKTIVLAKRAVNAHKRTNKRVLILTFNITLINYIHDRISEIRENYDWDFFYIINYHNFITTEMNNYGIKLVLPENFYSFTPKEKSSYFEKKWYSNEQLFESVSYKIQKFDHIFIDEVQDFKIQWLRIIKKYFLMPKGEYVLFGDEKQNIYKQEMDADRKPKTNVLGKWNQELTQTFRFSHKAAQVAKEFQIFFFSKKYEIDQFEISFETASDGKFIYNFFENYNLDEIFEYIRKLSNEYSLHPNDICVLSERIELLKELDFFIRRASSEKTLTTFETKEIDFSIYFDYVSKKYPEKINQLLKYFYNDKNTLIGALCYYEFLDHSFAQAMLDNILTKLKININNFHSSVKSYKEIITKELGADFRLQYDEDIELIRKNKKLHFRMNPGYIKISTIHSFKGWDVKNLFLIIGNDNNNKFENPELIYTALTRCRSNLFIMNLGNTYYDSFFKSLSIT